MLSSPTIIAAATGNISATSSGHAGMSCASGSSNNASVTQHSSTFWASPPPMIDYGGSPSMLLPSSTQSSSSYYSSLDYSLYAPSLHLVYIKRFSTVEKQKMIFSYSNELGLSMKTAASQELDSR